jgi:hypothetical protein
MANVFPRTQPDSTYENDIYAYLVRAREQLDTNAQRNLFYAAFELRCAIESRLQQYLDAREDIAKHKKKGWRLAASHMELGKIFKDGRTIVELQLSANTVEEVRLFYTPVTKDMISAGDRLGDLLHHHKEALDHRDDWWKTTRTFLENTFSDIEFAAAGTLLAPPMRSRDGRQVYVKSFFHQSNPQNNALTKFTKLPRGAEMNSRIHLHSVLPDYAQPLLNSWRCELI